MQARPEPPPTINISVGDQWSSVGDHKHRGRSLDCIVGDHWIALWAITRIALWAITRIRPYDGIND